jgi:hypothetical protein
MAVTKQALTVSSPGTGLVALQIGPEGFIFPIQRLHALWDGVRDLEDLLFQIHVVLVQAGVDPHTATPAQLKAAVEAQTYWWGA